MKNSIFKSFFDFGPKAIKKPFDSLISLYPYASIFLLIAFTFRVLYIVLIREKSKNNDNNNEELMQYVNFDIYKKHIINITIIILMDILLSIPLTIIYTYFIILLIIISIPFKFAPLKYYSGVVFSRL